MKTRTLMLFAAAAMITACAEEQIIDRNTTSLFVTPLADGSILSVNGQDRVRSDSFGSGYAFKAGNRVGDDGIAAVAGILPGTSVLPAPTSGTVNYSGTFNMVYGSDFEVNGDALTGTSRTFGGALDLAADFDNGRLTGSADDLTINGRISGNDLSGSVSYNGVSGDLDGLIGSDKAVGAFHGNDSDEIYAGGFYVLPTD